MDLNRVRLSVVELAIAASQQILQGYRAQRRQDVHKKSDGSPVTAIDHQVDAFLRNQLSTRWPYPVISEESPVPDYSIRRDWERLWLVDPLDGTREFVERTGDFSVNIALIENEQPILGVIAAPAFGLVWSASQNAGVFRRCANLPEQRLVQRTDVPVYRALLSRRQNLSRLSTRPELADIREFWRLGSAFKFGRLVDGVAGTYMRLAPSMEWDTAAGHAILHELGGELLDLSTGAPMRYNRENLTNNSFVARYTKSCSTLA